MLTRLHGVADMARGRAWPCAGCGGKAMRCRCEPDDSSFRMRIARHPGPRFEHGILVLARVCDTITLHRTRWASR